MQISPLPNKPRLFAPLHFRFETQHLPLALAFLGPPALLFQQHLPLQILLFAAAAVHRFAQLGQGRTDRIGIVRVLPQCRLQTGDLPPGIACGAAHLLYIAGFGQPGIGLQRCIAIALRHLDVQRFPLFFCRFPGPFEGFAYGFPLGFLFPHPTVPAFSRRLLCLIGRLVLVGGPLAGGPLISRPALPVLPNGRYRHPASLLFAQDPDPSMVNIGRLAELDNPLLYPAPLACRSLNTP